MVVMVMVVVHFAFKLRSKQFQWSSKHSQSKEVCCYILQVVVVVAGAVLPFLLLMLAMRAPKHDDDGSQSDTEAKG